MVFKKDWMVLPKHLFADNKAEAIVNKFHTITSVTELQDAIGRESFPGQINWIFSWITRYK
jgi:hypothetical protein